MDEQDFISPAQKVHQDALLAVTRSAGAPVQRVVSSNSLKDRIRFRTKRLILAGGDGIFQRFARSSNTNVIQRF